MEFKPANFIINGVEGVFSGFTKGEKWWTSFECPYFSKEEADKFVKAYNNDAYATDCKAGYDADNDTFWFETVAGDPDSVDEFKGVDITVDGKAIHVYPLGKECWIWTEALTA